MMGQGQPIIVLKEGTKREKGKGAQANNIMAAKAIADAVRSTLGPKGMDKMLVDSMGDVVITNDGVTILKEIDVEHPAAKMLVEVAKTQDQECGDGTTTSVILAGELLSNAEGLIEQNVHPTIIAAGYRMAADKAIELLKDNAKPVKFEDNETLQYIAKTAMSSKSASGAKEHLGDIIVKAVKAITEKKNGKYTSDIDNILVVKKAGGSIHETTLIDGIILDKEIVHPQMPKVLEGAKVALLDAALEIKKTEVEAKIQVTDPNQLQAFLDGEERTIKNMVDVIKKSGANVVLCQKGVDDLAQHYFAKAGVMVARRIKKSDMEKLAKAIGGNIVMNLKELTEKDLGIAGKVEEKKIGDSQMIFVTGCRNAKAVSMLIRGGTEHVIDETERAVHDALKVVSDAIEDGFIIPGAGASAVELALRLKQYASSVGGREQLAIEEFAKALETIPRVLAENAGLDPINVLVDLRQAHEAGKKDFGINVFTGKAESMFKANVIEPIRVGSQAIKSSTEAAVMILRIDDIIASKGGSKMPAGGPGMGGGMPGMGDY
jgi:thermosome